MFVRMLTLPDRWLNRCTMYRLVMLYLGALLGISVLEVWLGFLHYPIPALLGTAAVAIVTCAAINALFATVFQAPLNTDSAVITGLILALIVGPAEGQDAYIFVVWAATLAMASKYILAPHRVHLFNPAAIAVVITGLFLGESASWWVGTAWLTPFVIAGGLLLVRKLRRGELIWFFLWTTLFLTLAWSAWEGVPWQQALRQGLLNSPIWFLGFVMLTEPVTLPSTTRRQILYGMVAAVLVLPQLHFGTFYLSPELAIVVANGFAYPLRSRQKRILSLQRAVTVGPGLIDFLYRTSPPLAYQPGQYMEWTLDHAHADSRGKRRYFTLASSPTERSLRIGVKFVDTGSSFKHSMIDHAWTGSPIIASQIAGDFTLPRNRRRKLAFIAAGIGITPFRSMVKYLTDQHEDRNVVLLYANRRYDEILYRDVFEAAQRVFRFRPVYVLSDPSSAPARWGGVGGRIDANLIKRYVPDFYERLFYISGSPAMVHAVQRELRGLGVKPDRIKTDAFSGLGS